MKYFESSTIFHFTWEQVVQGFWKRYPNPQSTHVLTEDTVCREIRDGKLYSRRLLTKTNGLPKWGERFIRTKVAKVVEDSFLDPEEKVLVTYTRNIGLTRAMTIVEKVTYKMHQGNNNWTVLHRSAWIDSQIIGFRHAIISFGLDRFRRNCDKTVIGFNHVLSRMFPEQNPAPVEPEPTLSKTDKLMSVAKKATDIAKSGATTFMGAREPSKI